MWPGVRFLPSFGLFRISLLAYCPWLAVCGCGYLDSVLMLLCWMRGARTPLPPCALGPFAEAGIAPACGSLLFMPHGTPHGHGSGCPESTSLERISIFFSRGFPFVVALFGNRTDDVWILSLKFSKGRRILAQICASKE